MALDEGTPMNKAHPLVTLVLAAAAGYTACGGTAIVDDPAAGSGGNASSSSSSSGQVSTASSKPGACATEPPVGVQFGCSGSAASGGPQGPQCVSVLCDDAGNVWESDCQGNQCVCYFNAGKLCACTIDGATLCTGQVPSCCPAPFPP